jgi:lipopolysaccharide/colanic/teichoic acid biosynthesis glycosyltransferase
VIFRQRRVGRDGRVFELLKFRTMVAGNGGMFNLRAGVAPGGIEGADRRTRIGRWLRSSSLDELPQLVNVLRGEMSLIGPRPERPEFAEEFAREIQGYDDRHRVKAGITGWAQANGLRGQTSIADRVELDNHYIKTWSPGLELRTLALTFAEVVRFREHPPATAKQPTSATQKPAAKPRSGSCTAPPSRRSGQLVLRIPRPGCGRRRCAHPGDVRHRRLRSRILPLRVLASRTSRRRTVSGH